jgi:hypothetical protein
MKKNKQLQFAEALLEHLKDDHGGQLDDDIDAMEILDAMGCIGISFTDESDEASLAFIGAIAEESGLKLNAVTGKFEKK